MTYRRGRATIEGIRHRLLSEKGARGGLFGEDRFWTLVSRALVVGCGTGRQAVPTPRRLRSRRRHSTGVWVAPCILLSHSSRAIGTADYPALLATGEGLLSTRESPCPLTAVGRPPASRATRIARCWTASTGEAPMVNRALLRRPRRPTGRCRRCCTRSSPNPMSLLNNVVRTTGVGKADHPARIRLPQGGLPGAGAWRHQERAGGDCPLALMPARTFASRRAQKRTATLAKALAAVR